MLMDGFHFGCNYDRGIIIRFEKHRIWVRGNDGNGKEITVGEGPFLLISARV